MTRLVRHKKRNHEYLVLGEGEIQMSQQVTLTEGSRLMTYRQPGSNKIWLRPIPEFEDGRFEESVPIDGDPMSYTEARDLLIKFGDAIRMGDRHTAANLATKIIARMI